MPLKKQNKNKINFDSLAFRRTLKLYILPLVTMTLFLLMIIFLIFPKISEILSSLDQITSANADYDKHKAELDSLIKASADSNKMTSQLKVINDTTPTGTTEVVKFRDKITDLTTKNGLAIISQQLSENSLETGDKTTPTTTNQEKTDKLTLKEVPFSFEIQGTYDSLISFIKDLSVIDDFIVVREMNLSSGGTGTSWVLKLTMDKYQFSTISDDAQEQLYKSVPIDANPSQNVIDYVNGRIK